MPSTRLFINGKSIGLLLALALPGALGTALFASHAFAAASPGLFDDDYVASCPASEKNADGSCNGLYPVHGPAEAEIALLTNGEASVRARYQILLNAKKTISIQALVIRGDESGLYLANLLRAKQAEGVKVRVLMDAASNPEPTTWWMYTDLMAHPGLEPIWVKGYGEVIEDLATGHTELLNWRFHDKLWIIDGDEDYGVAVMGGLNVANEYFRADTLKPSMLWRDQDLIVRGPVVKDLAHAFEINNSYFLQTQKQPVFTQIENEIIKLVHDGGVLSTTAAALLERWQGSIDDPLRSFQVQLTDPNTGELRTTVMVPPFPVSDHIMTHLDELAHSPLPLEQLFKPSTVRFLHNRPRLQETYIRDAYIDRLDTATEEVLIANAYFLPNPELLEALKRTARRGVAVTVITNSPETNDLKELSYASRHMFKELMDAGVHVYEWRGDKHGQGTIHAKFAVFDRLSAIVGSYNLDPRSEQLNSETVMAFDNPELATELAEQYVGSDLANSEQVSNADAVRYHDNKKWGQIQAKTFLAIKFKGLL